MVGASEAISAHKHSCKTGPLTPSSLLYCSVTVGIVVSSEGGNFEKGFVGFPRCSGQVHQQQDVAVDPPTGSRAIGVKLQLPPEDAHEEESR